MSAVQEFLDLVSVHYLQRGGPSLACCYRAVSAARARTVGGQPPLSLRQVRRFMARPGVAALVATAR